MKKPRYMKLMVLAIAMMLATVLLVACGGSTTPAPAPQANQPPDPAAATPAPAISPAVDKMFNIVLLQTFPGLDPLRTNDNSSAVIRSQIYETLYRLRPDKNEFICILAESLPEFSADGLTATIKLRQGVTFHDGTPFNADAVKYTIDLIKDPNFGASRPSLAASIEEVEIVDDYTVRFHLRYEDGVLTAKFCHSNSAIVSPPAPQTRDLMIDPVGTGAYKFVSSVSGSNVVLTRNEDYWGAQPEIKDITFTVITEESTALARMETGEADFVVQISGESVNRVSSMPNVVFKRSEAARVQTFEMRPNSSVNPIMANKDFRIAMAKAIDKESFVEFVMNNYASVANSVIGPKVLGWTPEAESYGYAYDPEGAKAILEKNGWADEKILLLVPITPTYTAMGEYIQANLAAAGFNNVQIEALDNAAWQVESKLEKRFDITVFSWANATRDGTELLEPNYHSKNSSLRFFHNNTEFDKLVEESKTTANIDTRIEKLDAANKILLQEAYVVPMYNAENLMCYSDLYDNIDIDPGSIFYVRDFTIK